MDEMDVDLSIPLASGSKQSLAPAPASYPEERLGQSGVHALNEQMPQLSRREMWQTRINAIGDDDSEWQHLLQSILFHLTDCLATTDLKDSIVPTMDKRSTGTFVKNFDKDMLEKWKAGVRNSMGTNDWSDLIPYRTCSSDCRIIGSHSNVTTVKLQNPKIMIPDAGITVEKSRLHFCHFIAP
jgi:hypothetical protein